MNRQAIEAELRVGETFAIAEWCRRFNKPVEHWPRERALASYIDLAVDRYLERLCARTQGRGIDVAAQRFGIPAGALKKRLQRQKRTGTLVSPGAT